LDARLNTPGWHSATPIPSLAEVVDCCGSEMRFQFEVKGAGKALLHRLTHQLLHLVDQMALAPRIIITSSHTGFLRMVGDLAPHLERGYVGEARYHRPVHRALSLGCEWLMPRHTLVTEDLIRRAHTGRLKVSTWTVNDLDEAERMANLGVESIIT